MTDVYYVWVISADGLAISLSIHGPGDDGPADIACVEVCGCITDGWTALMLRSGYPCDR